MAKQNPLITEIKAVQKKYGKFESLELLIPDLNGILKGKRVRPNDFEKSCKGGFVFCAGATLLTTLGEAVSGIPYGEGDGDPDLATLNNGGPFQLLENDSPATPWIGVRILDRPPNRQAIGARVILTGAGVGEFSFRRVPANAVILQVRGKARSRSGDTTRAFRSQ